MVGHAGIKKEVNQSKPELRRKKGGNTWFKGERVGEKRGVEEICG